MRLCFIFHAAIMTTRRPSTSCLLAETIVFFILLFILHPMRTMESTSNLIKPKWNKLDDVNLNKSHELAENDVANLFSLECDYHSIESNYESSPSVQAPNRKLVLAEGSDLRYHCTLLIDSINCSMHNHPQLQRSTVAAANASNLFPLHCQDVQIVMQLPENIRKGQFTSVQENAWQMPHYPGVDKYVAWLNITNFRVLYQGEYRFRFELTPSALLLSEHQLTLQHTDYVNRSSFAPCSHGSSFNALLCLRNLRTNERCMNCGGRIKAYLLVSGLTVFVVVIFLLFFLFMGKVRNSFNLAP